MRSNCTVVRIKTAVPHDVAGAGQLPRRNAGGYRHRAGNVSAGYLSGVRHVKVRLRERLCVDAVTMVLSGDVPLFLNVGTPTNQAQACADTAGHFGHGIVASV